MVEVICDNATDFLADKNFPAIITSLPDAKEINLNLGDWREWFVGAARLCVDASAQTVFYQTDRKHGGEHQDKRSLLVGACGNPRWAKIVLRRAVGAVDLRRPGYAHLIAFGGAGPGTASPDVIPPSKAHYRDGVPLNAARVAAAWVGGGPVCDPFCGRGGFFPALLERGLDVVGIDIDPEQCRHARNIGALL